jgi:hypothetical protein
MRSIVISGLFALSLLPTPVIAQTASQAAAAPSGSASASPQGAEKPVPPRAGGISREQYIQRVEERAGRRAAAQFDQMDTDHDGVLQPAEIRAWRSQHARRGRTQPDQPAPQ